MRTKIIKIVNSLGVRIPKLLLKQSDLLSEFEIEVKGDYLTIRPTSHLRAGWDKALITMAEQKDDVLLDSGDANDWDRSHWEW